MKLKTLEVNFLLDRFNILAYLGLWIDGDKTIHWEYEIHLKVWCNMRFERFPFDNQVVLLKSLLLEVFTLYFLLAM